MHRNALYITWKKNRVPVAYDTSGDDVLDSETTRKVRAGLGVISIFKDYYDTSLYLLKSVEEHKNLDLGFRTFIKEHAKHFNIRNFDTYNTVTAITLRKSFVYIRAIIIQII